MITPGQFAKELKSIKGKAYMAKTDEERRIASIVISAIDDAAETIAGELAISNPSFDWVAFLRIVGLGPDRDGGSN